MTKIYLQHTMRYLVVLVAIGLAAADDGPCFSHVAVRYPVDNLCFEQCLFVLIIMVLALLLHVAVRQCSLIRSVDKIFYLKIQKKLLDQ